MNGKRIRIVIHIGIKTKAASQFQCRAVQFDGIRKARFIRFESMPVSVRMKYFGIGPQTRKRPVGIGISHHKLHTPSTGTDHSEQGLRIFNDFPLQAQSFVHALQPIDFQQYPTVILLQFAFPESPGKEQLR